LSRNNTGVSVRTGDSFTRYRDTTLQPNTSSASSASDDSPPSKTTWGFICKLFTFSWCSPKKPKEPETLEAQVQKRIERLEEKKKWDILGFLFGCCVLTADKKKQDVQVKWSNYHRLGGDTKENFDELEKALKAPRRTALFRPASSYRKLEKELAIEATNKSFKRQH
jgi:hypothetical protein